VRIAKFHTYSSHHFAARKLFIPGEISKCSLVKFQCLTIHLTSQVLGVFTIPVYGRFMAARKKTTVVYHCLPSFSLVHFRDFGVYLAHYQQPMWGKTPLREEYELASASNH
jgi:hypothetical protein